MGKNQSKEHRKSKENTPEPEKPKKSIESQSPTPETKRISTLQALKALATPPKLRKSDSARSKIQWPTSTKKAHARSNSSTQPRSKTSEAQEVAGALKHTQDSNLSARRTSAHDRSVESTTNCRDPTSQFEKFSITSPSRLHSSEAESDWALQETAAAVTIPISTTLKRETSTTMPAQRKENVRLSPTTEIRSNIMANSGIASTPTQRIFDAATKNRNEAQPTMEQPKASSPTSTSSHVDVRREKGHTDTVLPDAEDQRFVQASYRSEGVVMTDPRTCANLQTPIAEGSRSSSRKRKSDIHGDEGAEKLGLKFKKRLGPEDFEKLAGSGLFEPGALCTFTKARVLPIPYQILEHIKIYYEEGLFKHATNLLNCICCSGKGDSTTANAPPSFIPPPSYIALLTTTMVHPSFTTDVQNSFDARANMVSSYNCLRNLLNSVGVVDANVKAVFQFSQTATGGGRASRTRQTKRHIEDESGAKSDDEEEIGINHPLAQEGSIWNTATDLWHVVGWSMNCSINYKARWEYYLEWHRIVIGAITKDAEANVNDNGSEEFDLVSQGILGRTILSPNIASLNKMVDMKPGLKRGIAACFADGKEQSMRMFPEVWKDELDPGARDSEDGLSAGIIFTGAPKLPLTMEQIQELRDQPFEEKTEEETMQMREQAAANFGGVEALAMRCRYLVALLDFDYNVFGRKQASREIYQLICDNVVNLPLTQFTVFLSSFSKWAPRECTASLYGVCANRMIDHKAPQNPNMDDSFDLPILVKCYLPFAANTSSPDDNAKLAYAIDSMIRFYDGAFDHDKHDANYDYGVTHEEIDSAIALGTYARLTKCAKFKPKAKNAKELKFMEETQEHRRNMIRLAGDQMSAFVHNNFFRDPDDPDPEDRPASGFLDGITTYQEMETENAVKWA